VRTIFIVRHGQTQWNVAQRMQGRMDSPLTEQGRAQALANGALLKSLGGVEQLWVSPSGRTTETAYLVNSHTKANMNFADELLERDCGAWSGLTIAEIQQRHPEDWARRGEDPYWFKPPEGENLQDMLRRSHRFLDGLFEEDWTSIALITHGVMSKVILKFYLGLAEDECVQARQPNEVVYRLTFTAQDIETHHFIAGGNAQNGVFTGAPVLENSPSPQ